MLRTRPSTSSEASLDAVLLTRGTTLIRIYGATRTILFANARAEEYARYLWLRQWDGVLPSTLLGGTEDRGIILNTP